MSAVRKKKRCHGSQSSSRKFVNLPKALKKCIITEIRYLQKGVMLKSKLPVGHVLHFLRKWERWKSICLIQNRDKMFRPKNITVPCLFFPPHSSNFMQLDLFFEFWPIKTFAGDHLMLHENKNYILLSYALFTEAKFICLFCFTTGLVHKTIIA